jgi:Tol biopolymer transport system component
MGLTADGRWALSLSADATQLYVSPVGAGKTRTLPNPDGLSFVGDQQWLPDGKRIVAFGHVKGGSVRGYLLDATTGAAKPFTPEEVFPLGGGKLLLSPDGRTVLCTDRGRTPVGWPVHGGEPKPVPGWQPDFVVLNWSEDGASLFCVRQDDPWDVFRLDLRNGRTSPWTKFDAIDPAGLRLWIDVMTPSGTYWAVSTAKVFSDLILVDGLK